MTRSVLGKADRKADRWSRFLVRLAAVAVFLVVLFDVPAVWSQRYGPLKEPWRCTVYMQDGHVERDCLLLKNPNEPYLFGPATTSP